MFIAASIYVLGALSVRRPYGCDYIRAGPLCRDRVDPPGQCYLCAAAFSRAGVGIRHECSRPEQGDGRHQHRQDCCLCGFELAADRLLATTVWKRSHCACDDRQAAEIPAAIACLALLPKGAVGSAVTFNMVRSCVAALCTVVPLSMLQPLGLRVSRFRSFSCHSLRWPWSQGWCCRVICGSRWSWRASRYSRYGRGDPRRIVDRRLVKCGCNGRRHALWRSREDRDRQVLNGVSQPRATMRSAFGAAYIVDAIPQLFSQANLTLRSRSALTLHAQASPTRSSWD